MNERIFELAAEAFDSIDWPYKQEINMPDILVEKFAELIVAECLAVCAVDTDDEPLIYQCGVIFAMNRCQHNIKQHFGVKE